MILPYWDEPELPTYKAGSFGQWRSERTPPLKYVPGYFMTAPEQQPGWRFSRGKKIWMSLTRMEVESHMPHIAAATGHTVIAGLGMGFMLYNVLLKPEVTKVTVIEKDREVIALMDKVSNWRKWSGHEKVNLVIGDATTYTTTEPVDFLYADIWPHVGDSNALPLTQTIQSNVHAKSVGFWTQEFDFISWCQTHEIPHKVISRFIYREFAVDVGLPLIEQDSRTYPRLCLLAVMIQTAMSFRGDRHKREMLKAAAYMVMMENDPIEEALRVATG